MTDDKAIDILNDRLIILKRQFLQALTCLQNEQNALEVAISELKEIQKYRAIGTVDECRMAKDRLIPPKAIIGKVFKTMGYYQCPVCGGLLMKNEKFCNNCGQRISLQ